MRFLLQYPITAEEVTHELDQLQAAIIPESIGFGDLGPTIRRGIRAYFQDADNMNKLLEHMRAK